MEKLSTILVAEIYAWAITVSIFYLVLSLTGLFEVNTLSYLLTLGGGLVAGIVSSLLFYRNYKKGGLK